MGSELIIRATQNGSQIALLEDKQLVEFHEEHYSDKFNVGDIYLGKVRKIVSGLNAAFVDIGHAKDAFLHYQDLGEHFPSFYSYVNKLREGSSESLSELSLEEGINKDGKISDVLNRGAQILLQIEKVPISQKGLRVSCRISLSSRHLILTPFSKGVFVSRRIRSSKERIRLLRLVQSICPNNFGIIIRTSAEGISASELHKELQDRLNEWTSTTERIKESKPKDRVTREARRSMTMLRDITYKDLEALHINEKGLYQEVKQYLQESAPENEHLIKLYEGKQPFFEFFGVERQLRTSFSRHIPLPGGGSLVMDQTEALHVVDINSGKNLQDDNQEATALRVNLNAVPEICRQIRLRNLGGIIIIDFIDMREQKHRIEVYDTMTETMNKDLAKRTILPLTRFGLMQITRHRVRPAILIDKSEKCPTCHGTGKVSNILGLADLVEQHLNYLITQRHLRKISITLHPYLYAYFSKGLFSTQLLWSWKYKRYIPLKKDPALSITEFAFRDAQNQIIPLD